MMSRIGNGVLQGNNNLPRQTLIHVPSITSLIKTLNSTQLIKYLFKIHKIQNISAKTILFRTAAVKSVRLMVIQKKVKNHKKHNSFSAIRLFRNDFYNKNKTHVNML